MTLTQTGAAFTGHYTSQVSGGGASVTGKLVGWVDGQVTSFTVNWPQPSITTWVGHRVIENETETIEMLWHLATTMSNADDPAELWNSVLAGADRFTRQLKALAATAAAGGSEVGG
jgi:hypothetical protein